MGRLFHITRLTRHHTIAGLRCGLSLASFSPMNLEDNVGDIIGKARTSANVSAEDAAVAAGLSVDEFSTLEAAGLGPEKGAKMVSRLILRAALAAVVLTLSTVASADRPGRLPDPGDARVRGPGRPDRAGTDARTRAVYGLAVGADPHRVRAGLHCELAPSSAEWKS